MIEYGSNYSEATKSLWCYSKDEAINFNADISNDNSFKYFEYKALLLRKTEADGTWNFKKCSNFTAIKIFK